MGTPLNRTTADRKFYETHDVQNAKRVLYWNPNLTPKTSGGKKYVLTRWDLRGPNVGMSHLYLWPKRPINFGEKNRPNDYGIKTKNVNYSVASDPVEFESDEKIPDPLLTSSLDLKLEITWNPNCVLL